MTDDRIPPGPLDEGDNFEIEVEANARDANDEQPLGHDRVAVYVPSGKGAVFAAWLHRKLTETPELRQERQQADTVAELKAGAS